MGTGKPRQNNSLARKNKAIIEHKEAKEWFSEKYRASKAMKMARVGRMIHLARKNKAIIEHKEAKECFREKYRASKAMKMHSRH